MVDSREGNGHDARRRRTRQAILGSAAHLFDEHGYASTTVAQIAAQANVSERTFYMHFPSKEDLLFAHVNDFAELAWRVADDTDSPDPVDRVQNAVRALIDATCADVALSRQAHLRATLGASGRVPRSLAAQLMNLARELAVRVAASTRVPVRTVAPMVGAAIGAVEAAGLVGGHDPIDADGYRQGMLDALDAALRGFRSENGSLRNGSSDPLSRRRTARTPSA